MCGIVALISSDGTESTVHQRVKAGNDEQAHRGPDDAGIHTCVLPGALLGLGHRRLSILDLTAHGHQPMVSPDGRYVLIYNGEVYNYMELAAELKPDEILDLSSSDTAVVLAALARWGTGALSRFNGMWALILYDSVEKTFLVSRDRLGIKPLYYFADDSSIYFGSEIKAILRMVGRAFPLNMSVASRYLVQSLTNTNDETFFENIFSVPPGSYWKSKLGSGRKPAFELFWRHPYLRMGAPTGQHEENVETPTSDEIRELLLDSVRLRMRSDVPVGILLSGGIDSSCILAAAHQGFPDADLTSLSAISSDATLSEESYIDLMAKHVGSDLIKINIDLEPVEILEDLPNVCWFNEQPVTTLSVACHRRLMMKAKEYNIVVLLNGQGADEQLAGYNKFFYFYLTHCLRRKMPSRALASVFWAAYRGTVLREFRLYEAKRYIPLLRTTASNMILADSVRQQTLEETGMAASYEKREWLDLCRYSLPMLLHYEDRMSMSVGREMRVPFLDYRLVELFARVPVEAKIYRGWPKFALRKAMQDLLPHQIIWRKDKNGFAIPEAKWVRGRYQELFSRTLQSPVESLRLGVIDEEGVKKAWRMYLQGRAGISFKDIFTIMCFETWANTYKEFLS